MHTIQSKIVAIGGVLLVIIGVLGNDTMITNGFLCMILSVLMMIYEKES